MKISPLANINNNNSNIKSKKQNAPHFEGGKEKLFVRLANASGLSNKIAQGAAALAETDRMQRIVDRSRTWKHPSARWCDLESICVTFFYMWNTWRSDKIDEERKIPSMIQNASVTIASSLAAATVDSAIDPIVEKISLAYQAKELKKLGVIGKPTKEQLEEVSKALKDYHKGLTKLKSNSVFALVVRFIVPVLMVPAVGAIVKKLKEKSAEKAGLQNPQSQQQQTPAGPVAKLKTTQGYIPELSFNNQTENKFKSLFA